MRAQDVGNSESSPSVIPNSDPIISGTGCTNGTCGNSGDVSIQSSFLESTVIATTSEVVFLKYMTTLQFFDINGESNDKVVVTLDKNQALSFYSSITGESMYTYPLSIIDDELREYDWANEVIDLLVDTSMTITLITDHSLYLLDLGIKQTSSSSNRDGDQSSLLRTASQYEELSIKSVHKFNIWESVIESNTTHYQPEIDRLKQEGLHIVSAQFCGSQTSGTYVLADNHGYFTLIHKETKMVSRIEKPNEQKIWFFKRFHSGVDNIKMIKNQMYLNIFASDHDVGFMRSFDGQIAGEFCHINDTVITSIDFDKQASGRFYANTETGEVHIFRIQGKKRSELKCVLLGKLQGAPNQYSELHSLSNLLVVSTKTGSFLVFNLTEAAIYDDLSLVVPTEFTPNYESFFSSENQSATLDPQSLLPIAVTANGNGYSMIVQVPGQASDKLLQLEMVNKKYTETSWVVEFLSNKGLIFTMCIIIIIGYQCCRSNSVHYSKRKEEKLAMMQKTVTKTKSVQEQKLEEIAQKLANFENQTKGLSDFADSFGKLGGLKSGLKGEKSPGGSKKSVRFADGF